MAFTGTITVEVVDDRLWELVDPVIYHGRDDSWTVPAGFRTDFATVPKVLQWIVPRTGRYSPAAVVHDFLCDTAPVSRQDADGVFRRILGELGVGPVLRWLMFAAVRIGSLGTTDGRRGLIRDLPAVVAITVLALPVIGPPTLLAAVALGVYTAAEWLVGLCRRTP